MNRSLFLILAALLTGTWACTDDPSQSESGPKFPKSQSGVYEIVSAVEEVLDTLEARGPITIVRDSVNVEVTAYMQGDDPALIHARYPGKEEWYYLQNRRTIMLREYLFNQEGSTAIQENQFFYHPEEVLGMRTRKATTREELITLSFSDLEVPENDPRLDPEGISTSAVNFIYGR